MVLMDDHRTDLHDTSPHLSSEAADTSDRPNSSTRVSDCVAKNKKTQRTCIASREEHDKSELLRFVVAKQDNRLYFDLNQKLPGRGIYVFPMREYLETALHKSLFAKAAKAKIDVPDNLLVHIEAQMHQSVLDHLGLARRAGDLIISLDKIEKYLKNNQIGCYITAASEESDGYRTISKKSGSAPIVTNFSNEELSKALNLENAVHLAIKYGKMAALFVKKVEILNNVKVQKAEKR